MEHKGVLLSIEDALTQIREYREALLRMEADLIALNAVVEFKELNDIPCELLRYAHSLEFYVAKGADARRMIKSLGGEWNKQFDESTGKFGFHRTEAVAGYMIHIVAPPSKTCEINVVEEEVTATTTVTKFVPVGNCGSILDDSD